MSDMVSANEILHRIADTLDEIVEWTSDLNSEDEFTSSSQGVILLNAVCGQLLSKYHEVSWREVMGLRDIIAHHYFDVDAGEIFTVVKHDLPSLSEVIRKMIADTGK